MSDVGEFTASRLTELLRRRGVLPRGEVTVVAVAEGERTPWSRVYHLGLSYTGDAPSEAPTRLFLKVGADGQAEAEFYSSVASAAAAGLPIVPCYDWAYEPGSDQSYFLLQDLSESHEMLAPWPLPPLRGRGEAVVTQLARFHAHWWGHRDLGKSLGRLQWNLESEANYSDTSLWRREAFAKMADYLGDRLTPDQRGIYQTVLDVLPTLWTRYWRGRVADLKGLTLIHGDFHPGNLLCPKDDPRIDRDGRIYLVDWQGHRVATGTTDLCYMATLHWYPERERAMPFLRRYHDALRQNGVDDYDWATFWLDYQMSAVEYLFDPVRLFDAGVGPDVWWPILQKALTAYRELGCAEALGTA